jgi:hypothetical protein
MKLEVQHSASEGYAILPSGIRYITFQEVQTQFAIDLTIARIYRMRCVHVDIHDMLGQDLYLFFIVVVVRLFRDIKKRK